MNPDRKALTRILPELHSHYYLHNFLRLCQTVENQYADLLRPEEQAFLEQFRSLDQAAQCLYVRLISRVGPWFRASKLAYAEIEQPEQAIQTLVSAGLVFVARRLSVEELGRVFTIAELRSTYRTFLAGSPRAGKAELLEAIEELGLEDEHHLKLLTGAPGGQIIAPLGVETVELFQVLFFGNRHQGLTDFVLSDLGVARYYPYPLNREHRLFPCREALDEYLDCCEIEDAYYQVLELDDEQGLEEIATRLICREIDFPVGLRRWERLWNSVARELERRQQFDLARQLYERSSRHPSRERCARILEAQHDWPGVTALCESILSAPWCEAEREAALKILARAQRKLGGSPVSRQADKFQEMRLTLVPGVEGVELNVAASLRANWHSVHFVENGLMNTLFGLAFWEQIFSDIPGAFHNPYQGVPRDMYDGDFVKRRKEGVEQRLQELQSRCLREELTSAFQRYWGYQCQWVDWQLVDEELLNRALQVIPAEHLLAIWQRQLFDPAENRSGFPDLIAFADPENGSPADGSSTQYCMIEVKGPGDALQSNQKRWLRYFSECGIPAAVAWVEWDGA